ncbi:UDP-N-acetylglucosamine 1-carboxyvinyltransferase 1 [Gossypium arboreum]|uniref:UDP-N-acetylglucosamine 1-carboxyvinyltransferase 1 n=1 Tax=Gossypium arboreum TaxID=29729 RepID=A0A0B0N133_GOSAR|nr:UDP-N-acetylglucosamine 1-carboxyvinyltransferase 1 [Gossypium arboreum]
MVVEPVLTREASVGGEGGRENKGINIIIADDTWLAKLFVVPSPSQPVDVAMNASTLQEYLKQQNKWANLETSNAIPKEMNASFMGFVLRSANEGISQKRVGNSKWPKQKRVRSKTIIVCAYGVHACH